MTRSHRSPIGALFLSLVAIAGLCVAASGSGLAADQTSPHDATIKRMLDAVTARSYDRFVAHGDPWFKANYTPKMFDELDREFGPKLRKGYSVTFLSILDQKEYEVHVWRLGIKDASDDHLVSLFIKDGKVVGFVVR